MFTLKEQISIGKLADTKNRSPEIQSFYFLYLSEVFCRFQKTIVFQYVQAQLMLWENLFSKLHTHAELLIYQ